MSQNKEKRRGKFEKFLSYIYVLLHGLTLTGPGVNKACAEGDAFGSTHVRRIITAKKARGLSKNG